MGVEPRSGQNFCAYRDHQLARWEPGALARSRPETGEPGLHLGVLRGERASRRILRESFSPNFFADFLALCLLTLT
jgi:hypothetical protein